MTLRHALLPISLAAALVLAAPIASAFAFGTNLASADDAKALGWQPDYGTIWATKDSYTWGTDGTYVSNKLSDMEKRGITPFIQWYYWGDSISKACVTSGCDGRSQAEWNKLGEWVASSVGNRKAVIVVETEFNKADVATWEGFDVLLSAHMRMLKARAPNADLVIGFGSWGQKNYHVFDASVAEAKYLGFQLLQSCNRQTWSQYVASPDRIQTTIDALVREFPGKRLIMTDLGLSTYCGWESAQKSVMYKIRDRLPAWHAQGLDAVLIRTVEDQLSRTTADHHGMAERYWGLVRADGTPKPGWWAWRDMFRSPPAPAPAPEPAPAPAPTTPTVAFDPYGGNAWWIQTRIDSNVDVKRVDARINSNDWRDWQPLEKKSWGAWAASYHAPDGSTVQFRATLDDGTRLYSAKYSWPQR